MSSIRQFRIRVTRSLLVGFGVCALMVGSATQAQPYDGTQAYEPSQDYGSYDQSPGRVARLAYLSGQVQFAPAGENDWGSVTANRPMVIGDRLLTGEDGRAVLELGDASIRIDHGSAFDFLNLAQDNVQIELSQGTLNLAVRQLAQGANFEVDTPTLAFVATTPGIYRIDDDPTGTGSMVTVFQGSGTVYGENGASRQVVAGTSYRFNDSALASVAVNGLPRSDDFDRFCEARDATYARYAQQQQPYVPPEMIGGDDLYQYGQWNNTPSYGNVWYPTAVPAGWAPYRYGHWAWIEPWGWTWVDNQPWGFAPFHYGRWVYVSNRWGWMPGPINVRPVYAPALVAFIGGSGISISVNFGGGAPVGWFPLGPRDVYVPWFHASHRYFTNVNVTNIRNVYVNQTVINNYYNDYHAGRVPPRGGPDYAYRRMPGAVTAVPRNVFTHARPVHSAVLKLDRNELARTRLALRPGVNPNRSSLGLGHPTTQPTVLKGGDAFTRPVVARHQPPPRPVEFAARQKVIAGQHGQPLTTTQMQDLRKARPTPNRDRVKLVPTATAGATANGAGQRAPTTPPRPTQTPPRIQPTRSAGTPPAGEPPARRTGSTEPFKNTVHPIQAPMNPIRDTPPRPNELPSARFAHPDQPATRPHAPAPRPGDEPQRNTSTPAGRLPVAKPIEPAPQRVDNRAAQQQREAQMQAQQRARDQQAQQQREAQMQAQQRTRDQQAQQQREAQMQAQQRARDQQAQQQREAQMQAQQRARDQQAQQQREAQMQQQRQAQMQQQRQAQMQQQREMQMQQQRQAQMQQQREMQMQQQRQAQMQQQREMQMQQQRQAQMQQQRQAQQPRDRSEPEHHEPPAKGHSPESSDRPFR